MSRATSAICVAALLSYGAAIAQASPLAEAPSAERAYYTRCANLKYKGRHKLFRHALPCSVAKRKARYVLLNRANPPGWRCSLANLNEGYGACTRGRRAFEFVPL